MQGRIFFFLQCSQIVSVPCKEWYDLRGYSVRPWMVALSLMCEQHHARFGSTLSHEAGGYIAYLDNPKL